MAHDQDEGVPRLSFSVTAKNEEGAIAEGGNRLGQLLFRAGLDPALGKLMASGVLYEKPWWLASQRAHRAYQAGRHEEMVIFAAVAAETRVTEALRSLLIRRGVPPEVAAAFIKATMPPEHRRQQLFRELTGQSLLDDDWRKEYDRHLERRNLVVHDGGSVTEEQAIRSIEVTEKLRQRVDSIMDESSQ
jgi:hypothetical protein